MTTRTPDDDKPGWLYPPFREGWFYIGATYAGHSDWAADFNRRTANGGWLQDEGDPVLAAADGTVVTVTPSEGYVVLRHAGGLGSEYRHMTGIPVKVGQKVTRGDRIGSIGNVGNSTAPHLHHRHLKNGKPVKMAFMGKPFGPSALSDAKPSTWTPPPPVMVQGPPPPVTWQDAYREAKRALDKAEDKAAALVVQVGALTEERDMARRRVKELEALPGCDDARDEAARLRDVVGRIKALVTL